MTQKTRHTELRILQHAHEVGCDQSLYVCTHYFVCACVCTHFDLCVSSVCILYYVCVYVIIMICVCIYIHQTYTDTYNMMRACIHRYMKIDHKYMQNSNVCM